MPTFHLNGPDFRTLNIVDSVTGRSMGTLDADGAHPSPDLAAIEVEREERLKGARWADAAEIAKAIAQAAGDPMPDHTDTPPASECRARILLPTECGCFFGRSPPLDPA